LSFLNAILAYIVLLGSIVFHEFSHALAAEKLGDPTPRLSGRLTLNPLPHIDILGTFILPLLMLTLRTGFLVGWAKPVPVDYYHLRNPKKDMMWIGLAGPGMNFGLAFLFTLLLKIGMFSGGSLGEAIAILAVLLNLILGLFNLLPLPPLDGSHIIIGLLPPGSEEKYIRLQPFMPFILAFLVFTGILGLFIWPFIKLWSITFTVNFAPAFSFLGG